MALKSFFPILPALLMALIALGALLHRVDLFSSMTEGAYRALPLLGHIFVSLVALLPAVEMLRASGVVDALTRALTPLLSRLGIPPETAPLMLLRPFSGSGALALGGEIMERFGADSTAGRCAAVMLGSTETTFYVLAVYFGAAGVKRSRYVIPAALCADAAGFLAAAWCVRLFL